VARSDRRSIRTSIWLSAPAPIAFLVLTRVGHTFAQSAAVAFAIFAFVAVGYVVYVWHSDSEEPDPGESGQSDRSQPTRAETRLTSATLDLASFIAAGVREHARKEWIAEQVAGEAGELRSTIERLCFATGLIRAAVKIRSSRIAEPFVKRLDKVARSEHRTRQTVGLVVFVIACYVFHAEGLTGVIADGESLIAIGGVLYTAARWRRKVLRERDAIAGVSNDD
jgi:hypothetical protein